MAGSIDYSPDALLGEIKGNTDTGVYGQGSQNLKEALSSNVIPIGYSQDVKLGDASIPVSYTHLAKVQDRVKTAIENMTGLSVLDVNIKIAGVNIDSANS